MIYFKYKIRWFVSQIIQWARTLSETFCGGFVDVVVVAAACFVSLQQCGNFEALNRDDDACETERAAARVSQTSISNFLIYWFLVHLTQLSSLDCQIRIPIVTACLLFFVQNAIKIKLDKWTIRKKLE